MKTDSYKTMKAQQKFKKTADQQLVDECAELARKLNAYRQKYNGIINYKFRKHYEVNLGYATLNSECKEVEIILNTQNLPNALKEIGYNVTQIIEKVSKLLGIPQLNLDGISEDYKVNAESGYFHLI